MNKNSALKSINSVINNVTGTILVWTPTVLICNSVATVLGNTDLAAGLSNQQLYLSVLVEKHSAMIILEWEILVYDILFHMYMSTCCKNQSSVFVFWAKSHDVMSREKHWGHLLPLLWLTSCWPSAGWAAAPDWLGSRKGTSECQGNTGTDRGSTLVQTVGTWRERERRKGERKSEMSSCLSISVSWTVDRR